MIAHRATFGSSLYPTILLVWGVSACGEPCEYNTSFTLAVPLEATCPPVDEAQALLTGDLADERVNAFRERIDHAAKSICWYRIEGYDGDFHRARKDLLENARGSSLGELDRPRSAIIAVDEGGSLYGHIMSSADAPNEASCPATIDLSEARSENDGEVAERLIREGASVGALVEFDIYPARASCVYDSSYLSSSCGGSIGVFSP